MLNSRGRKSQNCDTKLRILKEKKIWQNRVDVNLQLQEKKKRKKKKSKNEDARK